MKVGVFIGNFNKHVGGGFVYQKTLLDCLEHRINNNTSPFDLVFFYSGDNVLLGDSTIKFFNIERYHGRLHEAAIIFSIDIMWFLSIGYEPVDIPYIIPVWDLQHRLQTYFPEVGLEFAARESSYNYFIPRASYILTGTEAGRDEISFFYNFPKERIIVNTFPVPHHLSRQTIAMTDELAATPLFDRSKKFIFYPAQFWPHKNHIVLLETLTLLKVKYDLDIVLVLTGSDHGNKEYIIKCIKERRLEQNVLFLGYVSEYSLLWLYQNAIALVYPSYFGPDNIPPIEAFAAGCPVIAANVSGAQEQLGSAALLIAPDSEEEFAEAVMRVAHNLSLRNKLIEKGYALAESRTPDRYVEVVFSTLDKFSGIRRCWDVNYRTSNNKGIVDSMTNYEKNKEFFSLKALLSVCVDKNLNEWFTPVVSFCNELEKLNHFAEAAIQESDYENAAMMLHDIINKCADYAPAYHNLAKIHYKKADIDQAFQYTKKAQLYSHINYR